MFEGQAKNRAWWGVVLRSDEAYPLRRPAFRQISAQESASGSAPGLDCDSAETAIERAAQLVDSKNLVAVLSNGDRAPLKLGADLGPVVLVEPASRGTCPSVFLAVTYILARAPGATAVILPREAAPMGHRQLTRAAERAAELVDRFGDHLVVLGADAECPSSESGWIEAGPALRDYPEGELFAVRRFCDMPGQVDADRLPKRRYFRNTMVMAVKVRTLWSIGLDLFPEMMKRFESLHDVCKLVMSGRANPELEILALRDVYRGLETMNFSRRVLHKAPDRIALLPLGNGIGNEKGRPGRLAGEHDRSLAQSSRLRLA